MEKKFDIRAFQPIFDFLMRLRGTGVVSMSSCDVICEDNHFTISYDYTDDICTLCFDLPLSADKHCSYKFQSQSLILREIYEIVPEEKQ